MDIKVYATPATILAGDLAEATVVVVDALRMTSVAVTAIAAGCSGVLAVGGVKEAWALAGECDALLGGERQALPIEGFDFSNSPLEYTEERISGHRLVMSTTNGTHAILAAASARRMLLGAFINASATARAVLSEEKVGIVCAGTMGAFTLEDALAAGSIIDRVQALGAATQLDDMALAAHMLYQSARGDLHKSLSHTTHYKRLEGLGLMDDLLYCLKEDTLRTVPERNRDGWFT